MKTKIIFLLTLLILPQAISAVDMKFQKKAADIVWNKHAEIFNPYREIPDSLKEHFSAVVIGQYDFAEADYNTVGSRTRSERIYYTRKMVKILDQKAVEDFSQHEFRGKVKFGSRFQRSLADMNQTFGARIYKPDGKISEVDISNAFQITEGKNDKDILKEKIDIPGLEPGDVLEYFIFTQDRMDELDLPPMRIIIADEYPVLESVIEGQFHPKLTVEFRGYNGAPEIECSVNDKGKNTTWLHLKDIPAMTDRHYVNNIREMPFYDFYILNNTSAYRYYPKSLRNGGLYQNPLAGQIFHDISLVIASSNYDKSTFPGKVRKLIKNYRKEHPDASTDQLIDMAWTAANYINLTDKDADISDYWMAIIMCDVLRKEKLADNPEIAFINPYNDVPTEEIVNWRQPDFGLLVGERLYLSIGLNSFLPGELHPWYQGQLCASYPGERNKLWNFTTPTLITTPISKPGSNRFIVSSSINLEDGNVASTTNDVTLSGALKQLVSPLNDIEIWIAIQEDFLNIPYGKRLTSKVVDPEKKADLTKKVVEGLYNDIYSGENSSLSDIKIMTRGVIPTQPDFRLAFNSKIPEAYSIAGDEMIVKIGNFAGRQNRIDGPEREAERISNICFLSSSQDNFNIVLNIPDGYDVDDNTLASLSNNIQTSAGVFISSAKKTDGGKSVTIATRFWLNMPLLAPAAWQDILKITDARASFNDALLVLKKKS